MEVLFACIGTLLHTGPVVACEIFGYSGVQLFQREELAVTESGVYPVIYYLHLVLYLRFMSGSYRLARYRHETVVVAHVVHRLVQYRLVPVRLDHRSLQIVRDYDSRNASIELQCLRQCV